MQIEDDAFDGLSNLESLSLEDNNILLIPATALSKLPRLSKLRLDYNRIAALSSAILQGLSDTLVELGLSRNVIREIPPDVFQVRAERFNVAPDGYPRCPVCFRYRILNT